MDLNGLKHVNDSCGHAAGDELICAAADCMKNSFSEYGKVYRIGRDEFVVITKNIGRFEEVLKNFERSVEEWHGKYVGFNDCIIWICIQFRKEMEQRV